MYRRMINELAKEKREHKKLSKTLGEHFKEDEEQMKRDMRRSREEENEEDEDDDNEKKPRLGENGWNGKRNFHDRQMDSEHERETNFWEPNRGEYSRKDYETKDEYEKNAQDEEEDDDNHKKVSKKRASKAHRKGIAIVLLGKKMHR